MIYCFDLDGTICIQTTSSKYHEAAPIPEMVKKINKLFDDGNTIKIFTARGGTTALDWEKFTESQLSDWGVKYHELIMGKPSADFYIDDKSMSPGEFILGKDYDLWDLRKRKESLQSEDM